MKCTICNLPIILTPSASERAKRYGGSPSDYTALFTEHAACTVESHKVGANEGLVSIHKPKGKIANQENVLKSDGSKDCKQTSETKVKQFNHAFDFAFEVVSLDQEGEDVTPSMLREALLKRVRSLSDTEIVEACGVFDTYEVV